MSHFGNDFGQGSQQGWGLISVMGSQRMSYCFCMNKTDTDNA